MFVWVEMAGLSILNLNTRVDSFIFMNFDKLFDFLWLNFHI